MEVFWFPYNRFTMHGLTPVPTGPEQDTLWVIAYDRTTDPVSSNAAAVTAWTDVVGSLAAVGPALGGLVNAFHNTVPALNAFAVLQTKLKYSFSEGIVLEPRDAFLYQKTYFRNFVDLEFTLPMVGAGGFAEVTTAFYQLVDRMEAWRSGASGNMRYPVNLSVHARFIKNSQATLSPAYAPAGSETHTCYIEYLSYSNGGLVGSYVDFNRDFYSPAQQDGWKRYGGLPNWGKFLPSVPGIYRYVHDILNAPAPGGGPSRLQQFLSVRDRIDPGGSTFTNTYLAAMFSGNAPATLALDVRPSAAEAPAVARCSGQPDAPARPAPHVAPHDAEGSGPERRGALSRRLRGPGVTGQRAPRGQPDGRLVRHERPHGHVHRGQPLPVVHAGGDPRPGRRAPRLSVTTPPLGSGMPPPRPHLRVRTAGHVR